MKDLANGVVYDEENRTLEIVTHRKYDGRGIWGCNCGHSECTGFRSGALLFEDVTEDKARAILADYYENGDWPQ